MIFTIALSWAGQGVIFAQLAYGGGKHIGDVDPDVYMTGMKLNFISQPIFLIAICVVKLSVGCALLRIASTKFYKWLILSIMIFMSIYTIGCFFVSRASSTTFGSITNTFRCRLSSSNVQTFVSSGIQPFRRNAGHKRHCNHCRTRTPRSIS